MAAPWEADPVAAPWERDPVSNGVGTDIVKTLLPSVARSLTAISGLPGDINELAKSGAGAILGQLGFGDTAARLQQAPSILPTTQGERSAIEGVTGGPLYQPQTVPGKVVDKAIQFAPAAIGGPETLLGKAAMTAVPAITSTLAGEGAKQFGFPEFAPAAEFVGALTSPYGVKTLAENAATKSIRAGLKTTAEWEQAKNSLYQKMDAAGVRIDPQAYLTFARDLVNSMSQSTRKLVLASPEVAKEVIKIVDDAKSGIGPSLSELSDVKSVLGQLTNHADPRTAGLAKMVYGKFQNFWKNVKPTEIISNTPSDPTLGIRLKGEADIAFKQMLRSQVLDKVLALAKNRSGRSYTQAGEETALRQKLGELADLFVKRPNSHDAKLFTPEEQKLITDASNRNLLEKGIVQVSKFGLQDRLGQLANLNLASIGYAMGGKYGGALMGGLPAVVGTGAKFLGGRLANKKIESVMDRIRAGRNAQLPTATVPYPYGIPLLDANQLYNGQ